MLFQPRQPPFLSVPSTVFTVTLLAALKRPVCWRWQEDAELEMFEVTTTGSHSRVGSQALDEVHHCLVNMFLW